MDPSLAAKAFETIAATGPVAAILVIAVWWQTKGNQALVTELNSERTDRLNTMDKELQRLRDRSDQCEKDRIDLHKQLAKILASVACKTSDVLTLTAHQ
jgi:hypothetical protein